MYEIMEVMNIMARYNNVVKIIFITYLLGFIKLIMVLNVGLCTPIPQTIQKKKTRKKQGKVDAIIFAERHLIQI